MGSDVLMFYLLVILGFINYYSQALAFESDEQTLFTSSRSEPQYRALPSLREQAAIEDAWTDERLRQVPFLLKKYGVDAWLISQREHAEDILFYSMKSATQFAARRRTVQLFILPESLRSNDTSTSDNELPSSFTWVDNTPQIWSDLNKTLHTYKPKSIAVNLDPTVVFSGGMHAGEYEEMKAMLGEGWISKTTVVPMLGVEYVANRVNGQLEWYTKMQETAWAMVGEAFSERVVVPGVTTTKELSWWFRDKMQSLNYSTWFHPSVSVVQPTSFPGTDSPDTVISYGDMLHVDFGITALGLNTDTQHLGYVLFPGETEDNILAGFKEGLKKSNRLQEIVRYTMNPGLSGNEVLRLSLQKAKEEGIDGRIYCHPIGDWGHSAGSLIGMTNLQDSVPTLGDLPILQNTYYSIELYAEHYVSERNSTFRFMQEEDVYWDDNSKKWEYVWARQEKFHLVRS